MIPKTTTPLTKFIRTLEGVVVVVVNGVLIIVPIVTSSLSAPTAVKYGAIFNSIVVASRSVLKGIASLSPLLGSPITPSGLGGEGGSTEPTALSQPSPSDLEQGPPMADLDPDVAAGVDLDKLNEPGTPHDQVKVAGATQPGEGWQGVGESGAGG